MILSSSLETNFQPFFGVPEALETTYLRAHNLGEHRGGGGSACTGGGDDACRGPQEERVRREEEGAVHAEEEGMMHVGDPERRGYVERRRGQYSYM